MFYAHVGPHHFYDGAAGILDSVPDGRSSILFAVLAGTSLSILTGRNAPYTGPDMWFARLRILGRSGALLGVAAILSLLGTPVAIILGFYAAWFVTALPFTRWSPTKLFVLAGTLAVAGPISIQLFDWLTMNLGLWPGGDVNAFLVEVFFTGTYPGMVYMAYVFAGMAIGRLNITKRALQFGLVCTGCCLMILGYGGSWLLTQTYGSETDIYDDSWAASTIVGDGSASDFSFSAPVTSASDPSIAPVGSEPVVIDDPSKIDAVDSGTASSISGDGGYWMESQTFTWQHIPFPDFRTFIGAEPHSNTIFEALGSGGFAIAALGLCLLIGRLARNVLFPLAAVGSMSLTAYTLHVVVIAFHLDWVGTDRWSPALWLIGGTLVLCSIWKLFFTRGPLEWVTWKISRMTARSAQSLF